MTRSEVGRLVGVALLAGAMLRLVDADGYAAWSQLGRLASTDDHMRLAQLRDALASGEWVRGWVARDNWPDGFVLHWTAAFNAPILLGAWLLVQLGWSPDAALVLVGGASGPATLVLTAVAAAWGAGRFGNAAGWLAGALVAGGVALLAYGGFGRADHHVATVLACLMAVGHGVRTDERQGLHGALAGVWLGIALWISVETLPAVGGLIAVLGARTLEVPSRGRLAALGLGLFGCLLLALAVDPAPLDPWRPDRLSWTTLEFAGLAALALALTDATSGRVAGVWRAPVGLVLGGLAGGVWLARRPSLLTGSKAMYGDAVADVVPPQARELLPIADLVQGVGFLGTAVLGVVALLWLASRRPEVRVTALVAAGVLGVAVLAGASSVRFATYATGLGAVALASGLAGPLARVRGPLPTAALVLAGTWTMLLLTLLLPRPAREPAPLRCDVAALPGALQAAPLALLTDSNAPPYLLWGSAHRTVAGPYHVNHAGLADMHAAFTAPDDTVALEVVARRGLDGVLVCGRGGETSLKGQDGARTFYDALQAGRTQWAWLGTPEAVGETGFWLYRVVPEALR